MAAILQMIFSTAFSYNFSLKFVYEGPIEIVSIGSDKGLALTMHQAIIWTNDG